MPRISPARKDARRAQILTAAARCFAHLGFQGATIPDICAEAGLSVGAVYGYFDSKDAIIAALTQSSRRATSALINEAVGAPLERLQSVLGALTRPGASETFQIDVRSWGEAIGNQDLRRTVLASEADITAWLTELLTPLAAGRAMAPQALGALVAAVIVGCEVRKAISPDADLTATIGAFLTLLQPAEKELDR